MEGVGVVGLVDVEEALELLATLHILA